MHAGLGIGSTFASPIQTNPFAASGYSSYGYSPYGYSQPVATIQWLQTVPLQIQQLQQLAQVQQQQLQQILQIVPAQLQQLQQAIQVVPQQLQQLLQLVAQQQFGSAQQPWPQAQGFGAPFQSLSPFTAPFAGSGQVM
jgi:hypothetical protein